MNIIVISQFNKTSKLGGGEMVVTFQQVKSLVENGHTVAMLTHGDSNRVFFDDEIGITFIFAETLGNPPFGYMPLTKSQFRFVENSMRNFQPDIIHSHTMNYLALMAQGFALKDGVKFLYTTHELPDKLVSFFRFGKTLQSLSSIFVYALVKAFLANTDKVLAINSAAKESTLRLYYRGQIDIVHNGVDVYSYNNLAPDFPSEKVNLYFVGSISERKNQQFLIKVMLYLPSNFNLYLIGPEESAYKSRLEILATNIGVRDKIIYTGNIDNKRLSNLIKNYHVFVSASTIEVQSVAVIEGLAASKPIVALTNETIEEFQGQEPVIILDQKTSPEDFANAVLEIVKDKNEYLTRANLARKISGNYTKERAYEQNLQGYKTAKISKYRNKNSYRFSILAYILTVGLLYRVKQFINLFRFLR